MENNPTLYEELAGIECFTKDMNHLADDFYEKVKKDYGPEALDLFEIVLREDEESIRRAKDNVFYLHEENPFLESAKEGRKTIVQSLDELAQINKGIKRFLPRRKDKDHNRKVSQMEQLVGQLSHMRTTNLPTDPLSLGVISGSIAYGITNLFHWLTTLGQQNSEAAAYVSNSAELLTALASGAVGALVGTFHRMGSSRRVEANYIDGKIKEHYNK